MLEIIDVSSVFSLKKFIWRFIMTCLVGFSASRQHEIFFFIWWRSGEDAKEIQNETNIRSFESMITNVEGGPFFSSSSSSVNAVLFSSSLKRKKKKTTRFFCVLFFLFSSSSSNKLDFPITFDHFTSFLSPDNEKKLRYIIDVQKKKKNVQHLCDCRWIFSLFSSFFPSSNVDAFFSFLPFFFQKVFLIRRCFSLAENNWRTMSAKPDRKQDLPTTNSISQQLARQLEVAGECKHIADEICNEFNIFLFVCLFFLSF